MSAQEAHVDPPRDLPTIFGWAAWIDRFWGDKFIVRTRDNHVFGPQDDLAAAAVELRRQLLELAPPAPLAEPAALSGRKTAIVGALAATGAGMSMAELAVALAVPKPGLKKSMQQLVADGRVVAVGQTKARRYHLPQDEQAQPATPGDEFADLVDDDGHPEPDLDGAPEPIAPPLDAISPRVRRELARENAERARTAATLTPRVDPVLRRRIGLYFDAHGRTDTLGGIAAKVNLTGDAVRPTLMAMVESGALELIPGTTPVRYRRPSA